MADLIDPRRLPVGQPVVTTDDAHIKVVVTRVDLDHVQIVYHQPITADRLLEVQVRIGGSDCRVVHFDRVFWTVTINGHAATEADVDDLMRKQRLKFRFDPRIRTMDVWMTP